jgi:Reverse transcriptase (RNA-dependent DNA polymerase)
LLAFADDLVLIAPSPADLQKLIDCFANFCVENDLRINIGKTQALFVNGDSQMYVNS